MFDIEDDGVGRGHVGIATNGDAKNIYWDGLSVDDYDPTFGIIPEKELEHREYSDCVVPKSIAKRQKFFEENYHTEENGAMNNVLMAYCQGCCSKFIEAWEKVLFYDC